MSDLEIPDPQPQPQPHYSTFTPTQKRWIVLVTAAAAMFSPLSSFIYYPAITSLSRDLHVSIELVNLTITSYMIVSGVAPSIFGDVADRWGRRPVYLLTFVIYFAANVGLAVQRSWPALLVLRMVQSVGSSGTIAIGYGVIADIASPAERGSFVGVMLCGPNVAPSLGPVLGGVLAQHAGWKWIFWLLALLSGICLAVMLLFLPETGRNIVGNGADPPARGINRSLVSLLKKRDKAAETPAGSKPHRECRVPNPMTSLYLLARIDTALVVVVNAVFYMTYCCIQASLSTLVMGLYGFNATEAGLMYIPFGVGCALASFLSGKLMDRDYRITAISHGFPIDKVKGDDLTRFPIEKARLRSVLYLVAVASLATVGYGWVVQRKIHIAVPLVLQFLTGAAITVVFNICGTLLVDLHPTQTATVSASCNIIRCSMSAAGLAALQAIIDGVGVGWCFTLFGGICASMALLLCAERMWGMGWRAARAGSGKQKEETTDESKSKT